MKNIIGSTSEWFGVLKDLVRQFDDGSITLEQVRAFTEHKNPFVALTKEIKKMISDWENFYKKVFNQDIDLSSVKIPEHEQGFDRLIIVPKGLTIQQAYDKCSQNFKCWKYADDNLDKAVPTNDRATDKSYAIWIRDRVEADEELKNLSADDLKKKNIQGITLLERLILELKYFKETGKHLDIDNVTLCSGSRRSDGNVPSVDWRSDYDRLGVYWGYADRARGGLRSRQAVS